MSKGSSVASPAMGVSRSALRLAAWVDQMLLRDATGTQLVQHSHSVGSAWTASDATASMPAQSEPARVKPPVVP